MIEVIIPWRGGCPHRERALAWVLDRLDYPVTIAPGGEPWSKGSALYPAIRESEADILCIHDADVWCDDLEAAVSACGPAGDHAWAIPHRTLYRLSPEGTARLLAGEDWRGLPLAERSYEGVAGGGVVCIRREVALDVPMDPRFRDWQGDDESWATMLWALHGAPWRGDAPLVHLWHPPQARLNRRIGSEENWNLFLRYRQARSDPEAMVELVAEARRALRADARSVASVS